MWTLLLGTAVSCAVAAQAEPTCGPMATGWEQSRVNRAERVNTVVLSRRGDGWKTTWNGAPVPIEKVRLYLETTAQMSPQPVFVLIVSPNADCREVETYRRMASDILKCGAGRCVEVDP